MFRNNKTITGSNVEFGDELHVRKEKAAEFATVLLFNMPRQHPIPTPQVDQEHPSSEPC